MGAQPGVWPWARSFQTTNLSFLACTMGRITAPTSRGCDEDEELITTQYLAQCVAQLSAQNVRGYYFYFHELDERTEALRSEGTGLPNTTLGVGNWIKPEVQVPG